VKEAVIALDIKDYTPDPAFNHGLPAFIVYGAAGTDLDGSKGGILVDIQDLNICCAVSVDRASIR